MNKYTEKLSESHSVRRFLITSTRTKVVYSLHNKEDAEILARHLYDEDWDTYDYQVDLVEGKSAKS